MPIDFSALVYSQVQDTFGRVVIFNPIKSQPGSAAYAGRGIFGTEALDVMAEEGSLISDQRTILDVREVEFAVLPLQGDQLTIPADGSVPAEGDFEIIEQIRNGGGETTYTLRKVVEAKPPPTRVAKPYGLSAIALSPASPIFGTPAAASVPP